MTGIEDGFVVLVADDDPDDQLLIKEAMAEVRPATEVHFVENGAALLAYLRREGSFAELIDSALPRLLLLDLNMPIKDGREALFEIKSDPSFWRIPIVVLSTSNADIDIRRAYQLGANSFVTKPSSYERLVDVVKALDSYWFGIVALPG
jgi:CheY-like chemotaxis protein